jgi:hypothetical protein
MAADCFGISMLSILTLVLGKFLSKLSLVKIIDKSEPMKRLKLAVTASFNGLMTTNKPGLPVLTLKNLNQKNFFYQIEFIPVICEKCAWKLFV